MAFVLTPRFAPAYQAPQCNPFGFCAPASRPSYVYRVSRPQPRRPQYSSFNHFFNQVDELLSEIDREAQRQAQLDAHVEAQREAHHQRQLQHKRALRANFDVDQNEQGWQINGDIQGFAQENISIEVTDENTLKIAGNTHWQAEKAQTKPQQSEVEAAPAIEQSTEDAYNENINVVTLNEPEVNTTTEVDTTTAGASSPDSDTSSQKSYQATVEDDFEDLGAEFPSSVGTSTPTEPTEPKGKERAVEHDQPANTETTVAAQQQPEVPAQQPEEQERVHGSFERTFRFPERIDAANVSASFKEGVLKVTVPRAPVLQTRRIAIL